MADYAGLHPYHGFHQVSVRVDHFTNIEHCERLRDVYEKRIICKDAARTYASPEAEDELMRVWCWRC